MRKEGKNLKRNAFKNIDFHADSKEFEYLYDEAIKKMREERERYYKEFYQRYVATENDVDIDMHTLLIVNNEDASNVRQKAKDFGFLHKYKSKEGRKITEKLKRKVKVYRRITAIRYEVDEENFSCEEPILEKSNLKEKNHSADEETFSCEESSEKSSLREKKCSALDTKDCCVVLKKCDLEKNSFKSCKQYGTKNVQLNYDIPQKILGHSEWNADIDILSLRYKTSPKKTVKSSKTNTDMCRLTPKFSKNSTKSYPAIPKDDLSLNKELPALKESCAGYSFMNKIDSIQCRNPVSICRSSLKPLKVENDANIYSNDSDENSPSSILHMLQDNLKSCNTTRRCLFKSSENKVIQNELCPVNLRKEKKKKNPEVIRFHNNNSQLLHRSSYSKEGVKIVDAIAVEEYIEYEDYGDDVTCNNTSVTPGGNSLSVASFNTPLAKSSALKPLPCSPVTPSLPSNINLKSMKISIMTNKKKCN